jgi:Tol biopolymer transport system component
VLPSRTKPLSTGALIALAFFACGFVAALLLIRSKPRTISSAEYVPITNFTDSAVQPALSPDGKMLAFIRGGGTFITAGEVYAKLLPSGEPVALTHDARYNKFGPAFSSDGVRIAYTAIDQKRTSFDTWIVPALGGEARLMWPNATGLSWIPGRRILFSEVLTGMHMTLSTAADDRSGTRHIYTPRHERGMAHFSYLSPDGQRVLLVEMDHNGDWMPCRVVPFDGSSEGRQVGPAGRCTAGGWSPDGRWMYFSVAAGGNFHIWRQRWPSGEPEQITFGPTEEEGVAIAPDGRSLITSVGMRQSAIWIHDGSGDREVSSEGFSSSPKFSSDGKTLYWLRRESIGADAELWAMDLASGKSGPMLPGFGMDAYDISADGKLIVFATSKDRGISQIWLASLNRLERPRQVTSSRTDSPFFESQGELIFRAVEEKASYLERIKPGGEGRGRVIPGTIIFLYDVSPDGRWAVVRIPVTGEEITIAAVAVPLQGGPPVRICPGSGLVQWARDGRLLYIAEVSGKKTNRTLVLPIAPGKGLPELPAGGIRSFEEGAALPGARVIARAGLAPGPDPSAYAYTKTTVHRNLFRIPLP